MAVVVESLLALCAVEPARESFFLEGFDTDSECRSEKGRDREDYE
jgi:hypothetical protein